MFEAPRLNGRCHISLTMYDQYTCKCARVCMCIQAQICSAQAQLMVQLCGEVLMADGRACKRTRVKTPQLLVVWLERECHIFLERLCVHVKITQMHLRVNSHQHCVVAKAGLNRSSHNSLEKIRVYKEVCSYMHVLKYFCCCGQARSTTKRLSKDGVNQESVCLSIRTNHTFLLGRGQAQ